jgi:hypothetical protein
LRRLELKDERLAINGSFAMPKTSMNNFIPIEFYETEMEEGRYILVFGSRMVGSKDSNVVSTSLFVLQ